MIPSALPGVSRSIVFFAIAVVLLSLVGAVAVRDASADPPPNPKRDGGLQNALDALNNRAFQGFHGSPARAYGLLNQAPPSDATPLIADNFDVLGHNGLGGSDGRFLFGDVWVHGDFAYVGSFGSFGDCTRRGVAIIDVSDLSAPRVTGSLPTPLGTDGQDVVVRHVSTASFTGDLAAVGVQRCGFRQPALNEGEFGVDFWDVTNPNRPKKLSSLGLTHGGGGVHELDLFQRGGNVYALLATPFSEFFDPVPGGDFRIVDATDPRHPAQVGEWGAFAHGLTPGPFYGMGSFGASLDHSARASADGMKVYLSYWDLGVLTLDISDVTNPVLISRTQYPPDVEGEAHSVSEYVSDNGLLLLQNDEDFDPGSPAHILYGAGQTGIASEAPTQAPLWLQPGHMVTAEVVQAANEGCTADDYPAATSGKIAVVRTPFPFFDPGGGDEPLCFQGEQELAAEAAGAAAVVHDFISTATSPQFFDVAFGGIPVLYTDHGTAQGMVAAGSATLEALEPSWGFLRVFDAETGVQVAKFDGAPNVHEFPTPEGFWSIHNNEVRGDRSYASWYSNGIVALDLSPLNAATPSDPVMVGQFVPPGTTIAPPPGEPGEPFTLLAVVWGVAIRESDGVIFVSDMISGLWIIRPTGPAAP